MGCKVSRASKCNFLMNPHVHLLIRWLVGLFVIIPYNESKLRLKIPCSYRSI